MGSPTRSSQSPQLFSDRGRAESFGAVAELYDRSRPSYPAELIDYLVGDDPESVLDVGCGTGIAAAALAARGCRVLGVEPDARMRDVARRKGLEVEIATFEHWDDRGRRFDLMTCGQAWHWIEPLAGLAKAARVLRSRGRIALFWNFAAMPAELRASLTAVYDRLAPSIDAYSVALGTRGRRTEDTLALLREMREFNAAQRLTFTWSRDYTTAHWREQLETHSDHQTLPERQRERLLAAVAQTIDAAGGRFEMSYDLALVTARRR